MEDIIKSFDLLNMAKKEKDLKIGITSLNGDGFNFALMCDNFTYTIGRKVEFYELDDAVKSLFQFLSENDIEIKQDQLKVHPAFILANANRCSDCKMIVKKWSPQKLKNISESLNLLRNEAKRQGIPICIKYR